MNKKLYEKLEYIDKKAEKTSSDLEFLIKNSENSDSEIRDYIAGLLVYFDGERAQNTLLKLCGDADELVRTNACDSLSVYPSKKVYDRLLQIYKTDQSVLVKNFALLSAVDMVKYVGADEKELKKILHRVVEEHSGQILTTAYEGLYILGEKDALKKLFEMLGHADYTVRCSVVNTFLDIADNENINEIVQKLKKHRENEKSGAVLSTIDNFLKNFCID